MPLKSTCAYLFVTAELGARWDPWWGALFDCLLGFAPAEAQWSLEPVQKVFVMRPGLTERQRRDLAAFLRTAPSTEIEKHRTLQRAVSLGPEEARRLDVMFFSSGDSLATPSRSGSHRAE